MESRTALEIVTNPSTKEETLATYTLRQWCRFITMTNSFFEFTNLKAMQDAYDQLCIWVSLTAENPAAASPRAAANYLQTVLNLGNVQDMCHLFCGNNRTMLGAVHIPTPVTYNGSLVRPQPVTTKSPEATETEVVGKTIKHRKGTTHDHQTWRGIIVPDGKPVVHDARKNPKNWYVAYSFQDGVTPLMYPGDPKKNGFADTDYHNGSNDYLNAVRNKFSEESLVANFDVRIMTYKRWLACDGQPKPKARKKKAS